MDSTITSNYSFFLDNKSEASMRMGSTNATTHLSEIIKE